MDRRVKASREEQLQKHAAALQAAMAAAGHASSAQDAGAMALQAAMAAASNVPKEGTQLKEMLKSQSSHNTLAHVLTHLWHTERLWRHALHQGLQLFQETHQVPTLLDWCAVGWCKSSSREVEGWGRDPFSRNLMSPTPRRKWYLTTGRRFH